MKKEPDEYVDILRRPGNEIEEYDYDKDRKDEDNHAK